jgi:oligogalacturonide lyase
MLLLALRTMPGAAQVAPSTNSLTGNTNLPTEWIDPDTGHRVIRLSREDGSQSLYFHQNAYTPDGRKLLITSPTGIYAIDLQTRQIDPVVPGRVNLIVAGRKTGSIYYSRRSGGPDGQTTLFAVDPNTRQSREVAKVPQFTNATASISTVNADESLLGGSVTYRPSPAPGQVGPGVMPTNRYSASGRIDIGYRRSQHLPMDLMTIATKTGEVKLFNHSTEWLNHIQFSPGDPNLLMFCHEGPWQLVDRIWTINVMGGPPRLVHDRTMRNEIAGHEFFSADGKTVWYDLQTPISSVFWVAGCNLETGARIWYHLERSEWSVHFNVSPDGTLFAGDGGGPSSVAAPGNGQWIYLFRPQLGLGRRGVAATGPTRMPPLPADPERDQSRLVVPGRFQAEKLVNLARHNYDLEPNVTFTPDMKWIVFRSNMLGPTHVYAVEIAKAQ